MKPSIGHVYRKWVSQWVKCDSHNCFILTIKKNQNSNTGEISICEKGSFWAPSDLKAGPVRWSDHLIEKEGEKIPF